LKRWWYMLAAVAVLVFLIVGIKGFQIYRTIQAFKAQGAPKVTVSAARAEYSSWQPTLEAVGSLKAVHGADLSAEVSGIVESCEFESGQNVKAGTLLVRLRAADDLARLESLKAAAALAQSTYERDQSQFKVQAVSQATLDSDAANLRSARAQVAEQQAVVDKKFIRAPFAGRVGIRAVDPGQYVAPGTKLVTLQSLEPIFADFYLPQQNLAQIAVGQRVIVTTAAAAGQSFAGQIDAINPQVDPATRNVQLRARLKNEGLKLLPGMYVKVVIDSGAEQRLLTLPQTAIVYNPYGASVYLVKPAGSAAQPATSGGAPPAAAANLVVQQQFVETGATRGDQVAILKGISAGELVVTSGQIKLKNGAAVVVDNSVTPMNSLNPAPPNE
jgi:membrane fusion protein (multidrug efflux system)